MTSGGSRNRSGPGKDPTSRTSERSGFKLTALPAEGRRGRTPAYPLPKVIRFTLDIVDGKPVKVPSASAGTTFRKRELEIWREYWRTPQAVAWERELWRWRAVAMVCRLETIVELEPDSNAALIGQLHRFRDQVGLTPAGLKENGWAIAQDQVTPKRDDKAGEPKQQPQRRLRAVAADAQ